jgi:alginate O-acetyltransferase complex protein AlgI
MENFDTPYYSRSISEFWRRWHISLSTWFRDYVYVPLGGSRVPRWRWCFNLLVTFGVSGLWHGANWTYVIWGLINGIYLIASGLTAGLRNAVMGRAGLPESSALRTLLSVLVTFLLVCVGWVFFRAQSLGDAFYILGHFWRDWNFSAVSTPQFLLRQMPVAIAAIAVLEIGQLLHGRIPIPKLVVHTPMPWRWAGYTAFMLTVVLFGVYRNAQFIYFQF